jgi:hypothetical protein
LSEIEKAEENKIMNREKSHILTMSWESLAILFFSYLIDDMDVNDFEKLLTKQLGIQVQHHENGLFKVTVVDNICSHPAFDGDAQYYEHLTKQFTKGFRIILRLKKQLRKN